MKKRIQIGLLVALSLLLAACNGQEASSAAEPVQSVSEPQSQKTEESVAEESSSVEVVVEESSMVVSSESAGEESEPDLGDQGGEAIDADLEARITAELLDSLRDMEVGTAGSFLKMTKLAAGWLNFLGESRPDANQLADLVKRYRDGLEGQSKDLFLENYMVISRTAGLLADGDTFFLEELETAGGALEETALDAEAWSTYKLAIDAQLGLSE